MATPIWPIEGIALESDAVAVAGSLAYEVLEIEHHLHNKGYWWGSTGADTETNAIDANVNTPYVAVSGNNTWGTAIPVCGTSDNPVATGDTKFDPHLILVTDSEHSTPYRLRFIYGEGTSAAAISAAQMSEVMFITASGPFLSGGPVDFIMPRITVGWKMWAQVWNATNTSEVDFFWGAHGYVR